jgi:hypothetical protein
MFYLTVFYLLLYINYFILFVQSVYTLRFPVKLCMNDIIIELILSLYYYLVWGVLNFAAV